MIRRVFLDLNKKLNKPSNVFTVGPDNCNFTSLVTALENGSEGDTFIVFGGTYDGKLNLRRNQTIHCIGKVKLKQTSDDFLFYFRQPSDYDVNNPADFTVNWSGSLPYLQFYSDSKWFTFENDFVCTLNMSGLYIYHFIRFRQTGTSAPTFYSVDSNLIVDQSFYSPVYVDAGVSSIKIFSSAYQCPPLEKQSFNLINMSQSKILHTNRGGEYYDFDINSIDYLTGSYADSYSGALECKIEFSFEHL